MDEIYFRLTRQCALILILFVALLAPGISLAQCNNWSISAQLVNTATCAGNGGFNVNLAGPDVPNLSNIQYGIATMPNGFSVPLNNSPNFSNMPPGTYQISAVAMCGGNYVGKITNASITVPGGYTPPTMVAGLRRPTLDCGSSGQISVSFSQGRTPFTISLSAPATYTGPTSFTSQYGLIISNLPEGYYTVQATDACGSSTAPQIIYINSINPTGIPLTTFPPQKGATCNILSIPMPYIPYNDPTWGGYYGDPSFKVSAQVGNNLSAASPFVNLGSAPTITLPLSPGKSLKDCYGQSITYTIQPPCGANSTVSSYIPYPSLTISTSQNCNIDFYGTLYFDGLLCNPITYTIHSNTTGTNYGPFSNTTTPSLPLGDYTVTYTTADGYSATQSMSASPMPGVPYSVSVVNGAQGLTNYIDGFVFQCSVSPQAGATIKLFNGPAGYYYSGVWPAYAGNTSYYISRNMTPSGPGTELFPPGNYVWEITSACGTYFLPITVGAPDLYQFTTGIDHQQQTCNGLLIWPKGTATNNGQSQPIAFSLLKNGLPMYNPAYQWPRYPLGTPILINTPGTYTLVPSSIDPTEDLTDIGYPNAYTNTYTFTYTAKPVQVDLNNTQGFLCKGASPGQGIIYAKGMDGIPFPTPTPHYSYWLAAQGHGTTGPFIANNTTGIFTNFGGNANSVYDVKVIDSCGAGAVQSIKILDLQVAHLISSNNYVACSLSTVQLTAAFLPNATYSWTGPNGFTSSVRNPVINSLDAQSAGIYRVTITTPQCGQPVTDSTIVAIAGNPPKPFISFTCDSIPPEITITNPSSGFIYKWDIHNFNNGVFQNHSTVSSSAGYMRYVFSTGSYRAIAIDTTNGCRTYSDSVFFAGNPYDTLQASITSPHLQVCQGDTTALVAETTAGVGSAAEYQWYKDGVLIPGATNIIYATGVAGNYKVRVHTQPCATDTSDEVTVNIIAPPTASISAPTQTICEGDHALITANTGSGFMYTWSYNDTTIPGASAATLYATRDGNYRVTISNGACVATSAPIHITVYPAPVINLTPNTNQAICLGDTVHFQTTADPSYSYLWQRNGTNIPNATSNAYNTTLPGTYTVTVANNPLCPNAVSQPVTISVLPHIVNLGNDTSVCVPGAFSIPLSVDPSFPQITWSTGATAPQISVSSSGTYWVRAENPCGIFTDTIHITALADYLPNLPADTFICNQNNSGTLSVPGLLQNIHWNTGATSSVITVTQPGLYWMEGESPCGILRDTVNVQFCAPVITAIQLKDTICEGDCITPVASVDNYPQTYNWSFTGGNPASSTNAVPGTVCYSHEGIYPIILTASNSGGSNTFNTQVVVMPKPSPRFADTSVTVSYKTDVTLPACAAARTVDWYKDGVLVCSNCSSISINAKYFRSVYHCIVSNGDCMDSCVYKLQVVDIPHDVWLPDAFSPNGDGRNDLFHVITDNPNVLVINLAVYNRWGQRIFNSNLNNGGWDGTVHGAPAEIGDYFWTLQYKIAGSTEVYNLKGDVTIVR